MHCLLCLLSIRSIPNESNFSPFAAVTGSNFALPQILIDTNKHLECNSSYIKQLFNNMTSLDFLDLSLGYNHSKPNTYVPKDLRDSTHVWLRTDRVRKPLEAPYTGPYPVHDRSPKHFTIELPSGERRTVSLDRLKPAYLPTPASTDSTATPASAEPIATPASADSTATPASADSTATPASAEPTATSASADPTATSASADPTATSASADPTATSASADPTATSASADPTATSASADPTATSASADPTATSASADPTATSASAEPYSYICQC